MKMAGFPIVGPFCKMKKMGKDKSPIVSVSIFSLRSRDGKSTMTSVVEDGRRRVGRRGKRWEKEEGRSRRENMRNVISISLVGHT